MISNLFDFTNKKIYLFWAVIITIIMSTFLFIQLQQSKNQMEFDLSERAISVARRVSNSVSPTVWEIYQKSKDRHYSKSIASGILDSELSADFLTGINVYGNFGHLFMGRTKQTDNKIIPFINLHKNKLDLNNIKKIRMPVEQGAMTIGHVEVFYSNAYYLPRLKHIYLIEVLQISFVTFLTLISLFLIRKFSLAKASAEKALINLNITQGQLIESEKMASLGGLVSGVAHEINTPLGICITAASHIESVTHEVETDFTNNQLTEEMLSELFAVVKQGNNMVLSNLKRAATLIQNFKKVAVDQSIEELRSINLGEYLDELLVSLSPQWKHTQIKVITDFTNRVNITSYPGPLAQIITNLIGNSLKHGFDEATMKGEIHIIVSEQDQEVQIKYTDNGKGMTEAVREKVFEPFFTTMRGNGGTGLGMHIVYNLVTQKLAGHIHCDSTPSEGTQFNIYLPKALNS